MLQACSDSSILEGPVFAGKATHSSELPHVRRNQCDSAPQCLSGDQQIIGTDLRPFRFQQSAQIAGRYSIQLVKHYDGNIARQEDA